VIFSLIASTGDLPDGQLDRLLQRLKYCREQMTRDIDALVRTLAESERAPQSTPTPSR